jgi:hypothetical protein
MQPKRRALARSRPRGGRISHSRECLERLARILVSTGHSPRALAREFRDICGQLKEPARRWDAAQLGYLWDLPHVISHWHSDPQYMDASGKPILRIAPHDLAHSLSTKAGPKTHGCRPRSTAQHANGQAVTSQVSKITVIGHGGVLAAASTSVVSQPAPATPSAQRTARRRGLPVLKVVASGSPRRDPAHPRSIRLLLRGSA